MPTVKSTANEIDVYIAGFPENVQKRLSEIRAIIKKAVPAAEEVISYQMPAYKLHSMLVYFAGYKSHIGFYPTASGIENFKHAFGDYKWSKGAVQFSLDKPLPAKLITQIAHFRLKENQQKEKAKLKSANK